MNKDEVKTTQTAQATWVVLSTSVIAEGAGGQRDEELIEQGKREKRDEQRLDDFRDYRLLSWEEASSGIGGRKICPAWDNVICRVSRFDPEAFPTDPEAFPKPSQDLTPKPSQKNCPSAEPVIFAFIISSLIPTGYDSNTSRHHVHLYLG